MNNAQLEQHASQMVAPGKGILAADESTGTIKKRFDSIGAESTEENRQAYRQLLFKAEGMEHYISGVILFDETLRQSTDEGVPFPQLLAQNGVLPGIKVDQGKDVREDSPGETLTKGLEGLPERLAEYYELGARFAKWRAVINIGEGLPTTKAVQENMERLAQYAKMCQDAQIVPIVEPEVLMDGDHTIDRCFEVTKMTLEMLYTELAKLDVFLPGTILKPNMVIAGKDCPEQAGAKEIAQKTVECFKAAVPADVKGIVFLSGGQTEEQACKNLQAINAIAEDCPWELSFSYGRALQASALKAWMGKSENIVAAQEAFLAQAKRCSQARDGKLS